MTTPCRIPLLRTPPHPAAPVGCTPAARRHGLPGGGRPRTASSRGGFTLVEMLVVVGIIGLLAAIITPAVMQALVSARNSAIKAEIDMLHMAVMNYRNEYGSFPPCSVPVISAGTDAAAKHVQRVFPRCTGSAQVAGTLLAVSGSVTPANALYAWLSGYTSDPVNPLSGSGGRRKLYDFDVSRTSTTTGLYWLTGKTNAPFIYIDSSQYGSGSIPTFVLAGGTYFAHRVYSSGSFTNTAQAAFNPDTFQILSAGRDEIFGTDDDLSNFWPGTRREYLDSL